jgi:signal transduction histidine kinase
LREETERLRQAHEASLSALATEKSQTSKLVASLRDAVLVVNRDGEVALVNEAMANLLGKPPAQLLQKPMANALGDAAYASMSDLITALGDEDRKVGEVTLGDRIFFASATRFKGDDGATLGRILTLADMTDLRRMAMEKPRFIRTMVHEFRSPLGAIRSLIEVALEKSLGDGLAPYLPFLDRADKRIDKLAELISDLLSLSRIDLERTRVEGDGEVGPAVGMSVDLYQERAQARGMRFATAVPEGLRLPLSDEDLRTVLGNLVGNAVKYGKEGGTVAVRAGVDGQGAFLAVADDGIGIRPENLPRLFEEFFREKREETRAIEGNGLGLSIVKRLVERAGGRLEVKSALDQGTTFTARFTG